MNKKGFTLTELLVVIALIGIITVIAVPSVIMVRKNVNKRLSASKKEELISAAQIYASDNPELFNSVSSIEIEVSELIKGNYVSTDIGGNTSNCLDTIGCVIDPETKKSMNDDCILIKKENIGYSATYGCNKDEISSTNDKLVKVVCQKINNNIFEARYDVKTDGDNKYCKCDIDSYGNVVGIYATASNEPVNACIISSNSPNNYLSYNGMMWRVMGLYNIYDDQTRLSAKMITNTTISFE